jgi:hypothetical protein
MKKSKYATMERSDISEFDKSSSLENEETYQGKRILAFCKQFKTTPDDLFSWLMDNYGKKQKPVKALQSSKESPDPSKQSKFSSNWRNDYIKNKTGGV